MDIIIILFIFHIKGIVNYGVSMITRRLSIYSTRSI